MKIEKFGIGQSVRRVEDVRFITGTGRYADDWSDSDRLHAAFTRSPLAHARITRIDVSAAKAAPGVVAVYTAADWSAAGLKGLPLRTKIDNYDGSPMAAPDRPVLAEDVVRHVGECVAMVVANTRDAAQDAAQLVDVDYDEQPVVVEMRDALEEKPGRIFEDIPGNLAFEWHAGDKAKTDAAVDGAAHVIRLPIINNKLIPNPMETRAIVVDYDESTDRLSLTGSIQNVFVYRDMLGKMMFGWPDDRLHVFVDDVGGGFGAKNQVQPEHALCVFAADQLKTSVKWISTRSEAFVTESHGRAHDTVVELALDAEHKFLGLRVGILADMGAYCSTNGALIPTGATAAVLGGAYDIPAVFMSAKGIYTNTVPTDAYRGAGRPEATYLLERIVDFAADELGVDRFELRRKNLVSEDELPYTTAVGKALDVGHFAKVLDLGLEQADYAGFPARRAQSESAGKRRGFGMGYYMESTLGPPQEYAEVGFENDGSVRITVGSQSNGQSHETTFKQLVVSYLGVDMESIRFAQADTARLPLGGGHGGSRSTQLAGTAIFYAAEKVIEKARKIAAHELEAAEADIEFADGRFTVAGTDRSIQWPMIVEAAYGPKATAMGLEPGLIEDHTYTREYHTFPYGAHMAEVEVDEETGAVDLVRYHVTDDFGTLINPMVVRGQVIGGVAQGIGQALLEHTVFDPETGQLLSGSFMDYTMPRADDLPMVTVEFYEGAPAINNPLGVKGCGEAGSIGAPPALVNAVVDALRDKGVRHIDMPLTEARVWQAIAEAGAAG